MSGGGSGGGGLVLAVLDLYQALEFLAYLRRGVDDLGEAGAREAVGEGAWGPRMAGVAERLRRALDFDHWPAFRRSFDRLVRALGEHGSGAHGRPPASIGILSGDVHHAYLAEVAFRRRAGVDAVVWQGVCSPFRNALERREPLLVELETFAAYVAGDADAGVVTLAEGLSTVVYAEAVLESAAALGREGFDIVSVPVEPNGLVSLDRLAEAIVRGARERLVRA